MAGVVASKVRRARVKSLIEKEENSRKDSVAIGIIALQQERKLKIFLSIYFKKFLLYIGITATLSGNTK